jgi:hypothetical protein
MVARRGMQTHTICSVRFVVRLRVFLVDDGTAGATLQRFANWNCSCRPSSTRRIHRPHGRAVVVFDKAIMLLSRATAASLLGRQRQLWPLSAQRCLSVAAASVGGSSNSNDTAARMPLDGSKLPAPPMVYIAGEEMTHYACELMLDQWIKPYFDTSKTWQYYDLSCKHRDDTNDQVLKDAVAAGATIGAISKNQPSPPVLSKSRKWG